ncbi:hypothetical protein [Leptolyngbya ohadii]|uniref:hypothetical protein n=1 Tax=Leptolyngbya ohadii TaxID=1962290 RepID=UPI000B59A9E3|nr:hypothetical protein [Leptolyngbya ohadii]
MSSETTNKNRTHHTASDSADRAAENAYDPHIIPAETAARMEREGDRFKTHPTEAQEASEATDEQTDAESIHTTDGYTVDKEGLLNNYAIEPEMYYEVPGDARQAEAAREAERAEELAEVNQDSAGDLTVERDKRGRGPGIV